MFTGFMLQAWAAGTIVAVLAGVVGFFVLARRATFAAHAIPNGAFAGAAGASLVGLNPLLGLTAFAIGGALGVGLLSRRQRPDVATALALVAMLALGAGFLSLSSQYESQLSALLFGEVLGVAPTELIPIGALAALCLVSLGILRHPLLLSAASPELARARGVRVAVIEVVFLVVLAVATALTVPVVGTLLTFALMIGPPAAARTLATRPVTAVAGAVGASLVCLWASLASAYQTDWPVGFFVGAYGALIYLAARALMRQRARRAAPSSS